MKTRKTAKTAKKKLTAKQWVKILNKRELTNAEFLEMLFSARQKTGLKDAVKFIHANR